MADPQLPGVVRIQAIQPAATGLPRDHVVNSWAIRWGGWQEPGSFEVPDATYEAMFDALGAFYSGVPNKASSSTFLGRVDFKAYNLNEPAGNVDAGVPPRQPYEGTRALGRVAGTDLPAEVCIVLTMHGYRNLPRLRGRVFLGPFNTGVLQVGDGRMRVIETTRTQILARLDTLRTDLAAADCGLGVISQVNGDFNPVVAGWVDDAYDIQRRRGPEAMVRNSFDWSPA